MTELAKVLEDALALEQSGEPGALATLMSAGGSTPRHGVAHMVIHADGSIVGTIGGGAMEYEMIRHAVDEVIPSGMAKIVETNLKDVGMVCGGSVQVLIEPIGSRPHLVIFGGGHVGLEIAALAANCGFVIHVADDRPEFASKERFPMAASLVHSFDPKDWTSLPLAQGSYATVVTRGHAHDYEVVRALVERELTYLGMMGSKKKVAHTMDLLREDGLSSELLDKIVAPIGMPIKSETPAEIAVSIVGQLIEVRRGVQ